MVANNYLRAFPIPNLSIATKARPPGTSCPTLYDKRVGSFTSPSLLAITLKMQETRPTVYSPYPRRPNIITKAAHSPQLF